MGNTSSAPKADSQIPSSAHVVHNIEQPQRRHSSSRPAKPAAQEPTQTLPNPTVAALAAAQPPRSSIRKQTYHSKRSIEFPDFAHAHMTPVQRVTSALPSAPIPIPMGASTSQRTSNGASVQNNTVKPIDHDSASMQDLVRPRGQQGQPPYQIASTDSGPLHNSSAPRGQQGPQRPSAARSQASGSSLGFGSRGPRGKIMPRSEIEGAEVVKSSIPLGLPTPEIKLGARTGPGVFHTEIPTVISWTPSKSVAPDLEKQTTTTRADPNRLPEVWVQDTYNGRTRLTYNPEQDVWIETVRLPLGNMSLRFLVDGELQMSTDLPLASDTDGALVNYVTVMPSPPADGEAAPEVDPNAAVDGPQAYHPPMWSASRWLKEPGTPDDPSGSSPPWTSEIPLQLIQAQAEEEAWAMHESLPAEQRRSLPIPPVPILPQAPMLPRHLDKVILSSRAKKGSGTLPHSSARKSKKKDGRRDRERGLGPSPLSQDAALADASLGLSAAASGAILVDAPHGDDDAVLPVPSHVVLHHLGTSAIRDGVIAVCDTVRYRKKYVTTVYYKPMYAHGDAIGSIASEPSVVPIQPPPVPNLQQPPPGNIVTAPEDPAPA